MNDSLKTILYSILIIMATIAIVAANLYGVEKYHQHLHDKMEANHEK